jgi:Protein of unknown function (DUF2786)
MSREKMLGKVKALLAKTVESGCTEEEYLAAFAKAQALIDAYEISDDELTLTKEEKATFASMLKGDKRNPSRIKSGFAVAVAKFTGCKVWHDRDKSTGKPRLTFCGLRADADFAIWLMDHLTTFVQGELAEFLISDISTDRMKRNAVIRGFIDGCTEKISERLNALCEQPKPAMNSNAKALVVIKDQAITDALKCAGIKLRASYSYSMPGDSRARAAGSAAGERASFGRPVSGRATGLLR